MNKNRREVLLLYALILVTIIIVAYLLGILIALLIS